MLDWLLQSYQDPRFIWVIVGGNAVSMASFLLFATLLTWLATAQPAWAEPWRIQEKLPRQGGMIWPSIRQWLINNVWMMLVAVASWPLYQYSSFHAGALPAWWVIALQLLFFIYLDDFLYYWMHRTMHRNRWLFQNIHRQHHLVQTPWAINGHYMHPVEYVLTGALMLLGPALLGVHVLTLYLWIIWRQWEATEGHCGYHLPFSVTRWLPGCDGALHHDYHHARLQGNYAGFLSWIDRLFGTWAPGYEQARLRKKSG